MFVVHRLLFLPFPVITTSVVQVLSPHSWIFVCFFLCLTGGFLVGRLVGWFLRVVFVVFLRQFHCVARGSMLRLQAYTTVLW